MIEFKAFLETFISDPDLVNIILGIVVFYLLSCISRALGFGLFKH